MNYSQRRDRLIRQNPDTVFLLFSSSDHPKLSLYRQDSDLLYLSGIETKDTVVLLTHDGNTLVFCDGPDPKHAEALPVKLLGARLEAELGVAKSLAYRFGHSQYADSCVTKVLSKISRRRGGRHPNVIDSHAAIGELRIIKDSKEIDLMRTAAQISARAHAVVQKEASAGMTEWELRALFEFEVHRQGCQRTAYSTCVGSGSNATILHARKFDRVLREEDWF